MLRSCESHPILKGEVDGGEGTSCCPCVTQFSNGTPKTNKYDHFEFNIKEWYWCITAPRGAADVIKKKFEELFRVSGGT